MKKPTKTIFKLTSLFLTVAMMLCMLPFSVFAQENDSTEATMENTQSSSASPSQGESSAEETIGSVAPTRGLGELSTTELATMEVNAEDIPEVIPMARALEKGLVNRLYAQEESLSTVLFQTKSGNKTAYVFGKPVKYVDAQGNVQDKSTAISAMLDTTYAYAMLDNSVKVYFPKNVTSGVLLAYNGYSITTTPEVSGSFAPTYHEESNAVGYVGVFGSTSILTYTPTLYGVKEDIVLVKYEGKNSFDFIMTAQGLNAVKNQDGIWELRNGEGKAIANLGNVIIKDSAGKTTEGELSVVSLGNSQYRVTVNAPEEFLLAENTVYPVYVDPTTTVDEEDTREFTDEYGSPNDETVDTIIDVGLYQSSTDYNIAINNPTYNILGNNYGFGRVIYKLYDFYGEHGWFTDLSASQIGSVKLYVEAFNTDPLPITANPMTATWSSSKGTNPVALLESEVNLWSSINTTYGASTVDVTGDGSYAIDITQIAKGWAKYNQDESTYAYNNPANGFCLKTTEDMDAYMFLESAASTTYDNLYYELDYSVYGEPYYLVSKVNTNRYQGLQRSSSGTPTIANFASNISFKWKFEYLGTNSAGLERYYIRSAVNNSYLTRSGTSVTLSTTATTNSVWLLELVSGGYMLKSESNASYVLNNSNGSIGVTTDQSSVRTRWELLAESRFVPLTKVSSEFKWVLADRSNKFEINCTPANATHTSLSYFTWEFTNSDFTMSNAGYVTADTYNGAFTYLTLTHKYTGFEATFWIGTLLESAAGVEEAFGSQHERFLIRNKGSAKFLNKVNDTYTQLDTLASSESGFLHISALVEGKTYQISSFADREDVFVFNNATDDVNAWRIGSCGDGSYYIFSDNNPQEVLGFANENSTTLGLYNINAATECCKWEFKIVENNVSLQVWYDECFSDIHVDDVSDITEDITEVMKKLQTVYGWEFGIFVNYDTTPDPFSSLIDQCQTKASNECTCDDQHHTYAENIIDEISEVPLPDIYTVRMAFTGHAICSQKTCDFEDDFYELLNLDGAARKSDSICIVSYDESISNMCKTAIHEFGHFYDGETFESEVSLLDHYDWSVGINNPDGYKDRCIYGSDKDTLQDNIVICPGCKNVIQENCDWYTSSTI